MLPRGGSIGWAVFAYLMYKIEDPVAPHRESIHPIEDRYVLRNVHLLTQTHHLRSEAKNLKNSTRANAHFQFVMLMRYTFKKYCKNCDASNFFR